MRHPGSVEPVAGLAALVRSHLLERGGGGLGVAAIRDERAHAADGIRATTVAGLHEQPGVRPHERHRHRDLGAVGQHEALAAVAEGLDDAEQVVPASGVQAGAVVAQLVQDLLHLERGGHGLDEHGRADRAVGDREGVLGEREHVIPQACLEVVLELRQVEVRAAAASDQLVRVVERVQPEVHERRGRRLRDARRSGVPQVLLHQVPATRPEHDRRGALAELVPLALGRHVVDRAPDRIGEVHLPVDHVRPGRAQGVLVVGEPHVRTRVHRVDGHLAIGRSGDLDPAILEPGPRARNRPRGLLADGARLRQEAEVAPVAGRGAPVESLAEPLLAAREEQVVQARDEVECLRGEDLVEAVAARADDVDAAAGHDGLLARRCAA